MEANDTMAVNVKTFRKIAMMIRRIVDHIRKEKSLPEKLAREAFDQIDDLAKEALIAKPRNCNVGTVEEQWKRFRLFCESHKPAEPEFTGTGELLCPVSGCELGVCNYGQCALKWAQMPYESDAEKEGAEK